MPAPELAPGWKAISDFSPGIRTTISPNHPPGTAQEDGTFRCYATSDGSLAPLPRLNNLIYPPTPPTPEGSSGLLCEEYRIIGLHANGPVFWPTEASPGVDQNNTEIFMGIEFWDTSAQGQRLNYRLYKYKRHYSNNPEWEQIWPHPTTPGVDTAQDITPYDPAIRPKHFHFQTLRSNNADSAQVGPAVTCFAVNGHLYMTPADTNGATVTSNSIRYLPGDRVNDPANLSALGALVSVDSLLGHQGRCVFFPLTLVGAGDSTILTTNECFYWSSVNNARTIDPLLAGFFNMVAGYENPSGYGVWASLTADELLLIKQRGGAIVLRGDLNAMTMKSTLPYVRSTGHSMNIGSRSPLGYLYPVDGSGIWLWKGGDQAIHITRNTMRGDFWRPEPTGPARAATEDQIDNEWGYAWTQACDWNEWVLWPNNWLLDTDSDSPDNPGGSWWRIENTNDYVIHQWSVNTRGLEAYGTPSGYQDDSDPAIYEFSIRKPSSAFHWRSQPLSESYSSQTRIESAGIIATGVGRVHLTVTSAQDQVGKSLIFDINNDQHPTYKTLPCNVEGTHITFSIDSVADVEGLPAPTLHAIPFLPSVANNPTPIAY